MECDPGIRRLICRMRKHFFDLSEDGTLVYQDPLIGRLENQEKGLAIRLAPGAVALELHSAGRVLQAFALTGDIAAACSDAFGAYFREFEAICVRRRQRVAA